MNKLGWIIPVLGSLFLYQEASAQKFTFREVKTSAPLTYNLAPTTITDSGDLFMVTPFPGNPAIYFLRNQTVIPVASQGGEQFNYANNLLTTVGVDRNGNAFFQDATGKRTLLTGPNGDAIYPTGINNKGVIAVQDFITGATYLYENGIFKSQKITVTNVNDLNEVCGGYGDSTGSYVAETHKGKIIKFKVPTNNVIGPTANAINNAGQVVGNTTIYTTTYDQENSIGWVADITGNVSLIDGTLFGPSAMPGAKGHLLVGPKERNQTFVWGENNKGQIAGVAVLVYSDGIHTRPLYYGFIGDPVPGP